jgi:hypothetical protein
MKSFAAFLAVGLALVLAAGVNAQRSPRLEKLALRAVDTNTARAALIRQADLIDAWTGGLKSSSQNDFTPPCGWDFSKYTITGEADSQFTAPGAVLHSSVTVFRSRADARGDYAVDEASRTLQCAGKFVAKAIDPSANLVSARKLPAPRVGELASAMHFVIRHRGKKITVDVIYFVRGRAAAGVTIMSVGDGLPGGDSLAQLMDVRLQPGIA